MKAEGKTFLITGAASGLGRALAVEVSRKGGKLALIDLNAKGLSETEQLVLSSLLSSNVLSIQCDVTEWKQLEDAFRQAREKFGRIDLVCNSAGVSERLNEFDVPEGRDIDQVRNRWRKTLRIDLEALIEVTFIAVQEMKRDRQGGVIINIASLAGLHPVPFVPVYAAAKAGVVNFTKSLSYLHRLHNIRVCCVCPGFTETPMLGELSTEAMTQSEGGIMKVEQVISGIMQLVDDDQKVGAVQKVSFKGGIEYVTIQRKAAPTHSSATPKANL